MYRLGIKLQDNAFDVLLKNVLWIASSATNATNVHVWNHGAFATLWFEVLRQDCVLNDSSVISKSLAPLLVSEFIC